MARGRLGGWGRWDTGVSPLWPVGGFGRLGLVLCCGSIGEPGVPAEGERAVHERLVAADCCVGADLEVGPAEFVLDLFVALLDPVPRAVETDELGQVGGRVGSVGDAG